jgi:hypothetical protein
MRIRTAIASLSVALGLAAACATTAPTEITDTWRSPAFGAGPLTNVMVFGAGVEPESRRAVEDAFASAMSEHGMRATPSYRFFPNAIPSPAVARDALVRRGFDGALFAEMKGKDEKVTAKAWGCCVDRHDRAGVWQAPVAVGTDEVVTFETTLWDPRQTGSLVWAASTRTENPSSARDFAKSLVDEVVPALVEAGLIPPELPPGA